MTPWQAALLGVLQGLTEFLPVSSSGHLALAQLVIPGFSQPGVVFDAMLHVGTALAVVWFERRQIIDWSSSAAGRHLLGLLVIGTAATAVVALPLRRLATAAFLEPVWIGTALIVTGCVVASTRLLPGGAVGEAGTGWRRAVVVGLAQGLAVFPGLSRSGMTIAAALGSGMERAWSARFSFLLAVPAIAAATAVELAGAWQLPQGLSAAFLATCLLGALCAGISGYFALGIVIRTVTSRVFHRFAWYVLPFGLVVVVWGMW